MPTNTEFLKKILLNFLNEVECVLAIAVCDRDGLFIASENKENAGDYSTLGAISAVVQNFIEKIKTEFGTVSNFFNITTTGVKKFSFCSMGPNSILTTIAEPTTSDIELKVYSEHVALNVELLLEGNENIALEIPEIVKSLAKTRKGELPKGDFTSKLILVGDYKVGKTSLILRYVENKFQESYISTLGVEITNKNLVLSEGTMMKFLIWDIAGQEGYSAYRAKFYSRANAVLIVVDRTRPNNLDSIEAWLKDIKESVKQEIPTIIIGNKSDLVDEIVISEEQIKLAAEQFGFQSILTSAKTGENVNNAFIYIAYKLLEKV